MPPQLEGPGCRPGPIATQKAGEAEEVKSNECEKKLPEEHKEASTGTTAQYRASQKEANNRNAELSAGGISQQTALTGKLNAVQNGNENASTTASRTSGRLWDSAKHVIPETTAVAPGVLKAAEAARKIKELQDEIKNRERDLELKKLEDKLIEAQIKKIQEKIEEKMRNLDR